MIKYKKLIGKETCPTSTAGWPISSAAMGGATLALFLNATAALAGPIEVTDEYINANKLGTVDVTFKTGLSELFLAGNDVVKIAFDFDNDSAADWSKAVYAGALGGAATQADTFDPSVLYRNENDTVFYCVDIFQNLKYKTNYSVLKVNDNTEVSQTIQGETITRDFGNVLKFLGALNWVLGNDDYGLQNDDQNWLNPDSGWMSGAIQVGIWESLYDTNKDITSGVFSVSGTGNKALTTDGSNLLAATFKKMADDPSISLNSDKVLWLHQAVGQDLLVDPVSVPEPGTLALLLSGLLVLGNVGRARGRR